MYQIPFNKWAFLIPLVYFPNFTRYLGNWRSSPYIPWCLHSLHSSYLKSQSYASAHVLGLPLSILPPLFFLKKEVWRTPQHISSSLSMFFFQINAPNSSIHYNSKKKKKANQLTESKMHTFNFLFLGNRKRFTLTAVFSIPANKSKVYLYSMVSSCWFLF